MRSATLPAVFGLALVLAAVSATAAAAQEVRPHTFRAVQAGDTIGSEVVRRTATVVKSDLIDASAGARFRFTVQLAPDGTVTSVRNAFFRLTAGDTTPTQTVEVRFAGDSARVAIRGNRTSDVTLPAPPGSIPWIKPSAALMEQMLRRVRVLGGASASVPLFNVMNGQTTDAAVTWLAADSARLSFGGATFLAVIDADGNLQRATMQGQDGMMFRLEGAHPLRVEPVDYGPPSAWTTGG